jgi:hypothetical protein
MGISVGSVSLFAALFFDIADRLLARDYIMFRAIRSPAPVGLESRLRELVLGVGYFGGLVALEPTLAAIGPGGAYIDQPADLSTPEGQLTEQIRTWVQFELLSVTGVSATALDRALRPTMRRSPAPAHETTTVHVSQLIADRIPKLEVRPMASATPTRRVPKTRQVA